MTATAPHDRPFEETQLHSSEGRQRSIERRL